ncbi:MAG: hypothetical protein DMG54_35895 [Acidobacteria bacterium]|nr:MAG: hypothetical protein DMG54_35895 [Acidobacteriota bacterium]
MKLIWIGAFVLLFASAASLVSNRQSGQLIERSWASASNVLPDTGFGFHAGSGVALDRCAIGRANHALCLHDWRSRNRQHA